jgi:hypothetical protein
MFDAAHLKLNFARAIVDAVTMLNVGGNTDPLKKGSLTACLLHAEELMGEAGEMFAEAHDVGPVQRRNCGPRQRRRCSL